MIKTNRWTHSQIDNIARFGNDHIIDTPNEKVYEWVKTGKWSQKSFKKWLVIIRVIEDSKKWRSV